MKKICKIIVLQAALFAIRICAVPAGVPLWQVLGLTDDSVITTESKLDHISLEFSGVFTALQDITDILASDISKLDDFNLVINTEFALSQLDEISSGIDVVQSLVDALEGCGVSGAIFKSNVGLTGYNITSPGHYYLAEDITFNPVATGQYAIRINANNVYLDLDGFTISQGNATLLTGGVLISGGRRNIKILNGIIRNMSGQTLTAAAGVNNVYVGNMQVLSAGLPGGGGTTDASDGIEIQSGSNYVLNEIVVQRAQDEGVDMNGLSNFIIKDSTFAFNGSVGLLFEEGTANGVVHNCLANNNGVGGITRGVVGAISTGIVVTDCVTVQNNGPGISVNDNWVVEGNEVFNNGNRGINCEPGLGARSVIKDNTLINNTTAGIRPGQSNCFIFRNTLIQNASSNIPAASGANSVLGNYAFNTSDATNYVNGGGTTINRTVVNTTGSFISQPVFWRNISAIP